MQISSLKRAALAAAVAVWISPAFAADRAYNTGDDYLAASTWVGGVYPGTYGAGGPAQGTAADVAVFNTLSGTVRLGIDFSTVNAGPFGSFSSGAFYVQSTNGGLLTVGGRQPTSGTVNGIWKLNGPVLITSAVGSPNVSLVNCIAAIRDGSTRDLTLANQAVPVTGNTGTANVTFQLNLSTPNTYVSAGRTLSMFAPTSESIPGSVLSKYGPGTLALGSPLPGTSPVHGFTGGLNVYAGTVSIYNPATNLGTGPILLDTGTLAVSTNGNAGSTLATQDLTLGAGGGRVEFTANAFVTFNISEPVLGTGRLTVAGAGLGDSQTLTLDNGGTYTGGLTVIGGATVSTNQRSGFGNPTAFVADQVRLDNGFIRFTETANTTALGPNRGVTIGAGGGGISVTSTTETFEINAPIVSAPLTSGAVVVNPDLTTAGTLRMSNNNSYSGQTIVRAGTLLIDGAHSGSGAISINDDGTLGGSGSVVSSIVNEGRIAPGSPGAPASFFVNAGNVTFKKGSSLAIDIVATGTSDRLRVPGGTSTLEIDVGLLVSVPAANRPTRSSTFIVLSAVGGITGTFANVSPQGLVITTQGDAAFHLTTNPTTVVLDSYTRRGDVNLDGSVNNNDIAAFVSALTGGAAPGFIAFAADADGNGTVNNNDIASFVILLTAAGVPWSDPAFGALSVVPEPGGLALLALAGASLRRRRYHCGA